jgi:uncharacterized protein (DUF934 family)
LLLVAALGVVGMLAVAAPAYGEGRPFSTVLTGRRRLGWNIRGGRDRRSGAAQPRRLVD